MPATPMMQQYHDAKAACPGAVLLFRMGDFYELFHDDAKIAARVLGLALTTRDKDKGDEAVPMAGFPHRALEGYLAKLIAAGHRVAIADQVEDPKQAKGLVRREVTRVVSAGTLTDEALLDPRQHNYLVAVSQGDPAGLAWVDLSTGRFQACQLKPELLYDELARIDPAEILQRDDGAPLAVAADQRVQITRWPEIDFDPSTAAESLSRHFGTKSLEGFGFAQTGPALGAAAALLAYLRETQKTALPHIDRLLPYEPSQTLQIDEASRRSLELTRTIRDGRREGSLLGVLDRTCTAMGSRLLGEWLANPLTDVQRINLRLDAVGELVGSLELAQTLREMLQATYDLQRLLSRVTTGRAGPRDLSFLVRTLRLLPKLKAKLTARTSTRLQQIESDLDLLPQLRSELEQALEDECPQHDREGGFIRGGYQAELDELRDLATGGKQWIAGYQAAQSHETGIPNLKVSYNKVFGYYIEVSHAQKAKVPEHYRRLQTVKNAERYETPELKEYAQKVLSATERAQELEQEIFAQLRLLVVGNAHRLQHTAELMAELDVLLALAELARSRNYCRPSMCEEPTLEIIGGRHPVLDCLMEPGQFVPNDTQLGDQAGQLLLITGPNMAGKSTYIRQVALITLLAQIGSFVPATEATVGVADRIFARVGASDELSRGQSTFMVEMTETARILNTASRQSLVILDEIGRGTSTYDGVSLAWSVVEHMHDSVGARTLFATHYHELTELAERLPGVRNFTVAVEEWQDRVVFLHKIRPGAADKSYGLHVAKLAGVPGSVIERAAVILHELESQHHAEVLRQEQNGQPESAAEPPPLSDGPSQPRRKRRADGQLWLFAPEDHPLLEKIGSLELENLSPEAAWEQLRQWQVDLKAEKSQAELS